MIDRVGNLGEMYEILVMTGQTNNSVSAYLLVVRLNELFIVQLSKEVVLIVKKYCKKIDKLFN